VNNIIGSIRSATPDELRRFEMYLVAYSGSFRGVYAEIFEKEVKNRKDSFA
jgi:hypothetical protein